MKFHVNVGFFVEAEDWYRALQEVQEKTYTVKDALTNININEHHDFPVSAAGAALLEGSSLPDGLEENAAPLPDEDEIPF